MTGRALYLGWLVLLLAGACVSPGEDPPAPGPGEEPAAPLAAPPVLPGRPTASEGEEMIPGNLEDLLQPPASDEPYRLQGGDLILVSVYEHPDLSTRLPVPERGPARFPLIGDLELKNRTTDEVEADIRVRLEKEFVAFAPVNVQVEKTRENAAYILGQVSRQGEYAFAPGRPPSLLQLVAKAGGFLEDADTEQLRLIRGTGSDRRFWVLSVKDLEKGGRLGLDVTLRDGDTLVVPRLPKVHVMGCVQRPGALPMRAGVHFTLAAVVAQAGGFKDGADRDRILLVRPDGNGGAVSAAVPFTSQAGAPGEVEVFPGDTVIVREAARVYVLGAVTRPGGFSMSEEALTATKAISLAGGFTRRADSNGTVVIRSTPKGQRVIRVRVKAVVSSETERQVALEPGDIVFVPERFF